MPDLRMLLAQYMGQYGGDIGVKSATLIKVTPGARTPGDYAAGTNPTETSYSCTALIAQLTARDLPGTEITAQDRKVIVFGGSLTVVPAPQDKVTIADVDGATKTLRLVTPISGDGLGAAFGFQARLT